MIRITDALLLKKHSTTQTQHRQFLFVLESTVKKQNVDVKGTLTRNKCVCHLEIGLAAASFIYQVNVNFSKKLAFKWTIRTFLK
jgi:hypothetical protein